MNIIVKYSDSDSFTIQIESSEKIKKLKLKIEEINGIPADKQVLIFFGKYIIFFM